MVSRISETISFEYCLIQWRTCFRPGKELPVSYTHLDVYKRQPYNLLATGAIRMSIERNGDLNPLFAERPVMRHWDFLEHRIFPVSYTHLDVYKRQADKRSDDCLL